MKFVILQQTETGPNLGDSSVGCIAEGSSGDLTSCMLEGIFSAGPSPEIMGFLLASMLLVSLYLAGNGSVVAPAVATILFGSILVPLLPGQFRGLSYTVVVIGITVAVFYAYQRFAVRRSF